MTNRDYHWLRREGFTKKFYRHRRDLLSKIFNSLEFFPLKPLFEKNDNDGNIFADLFGYSSSPIEPKVMVLAIDRWGRYLPEEGDPLYLLIIFAILTSQNPFTFNSAAGRASDQLVRALVKRDLESLELLARLGSKTIFKIDSRAEGLPPLDFEGVINRNSPGPRAPLVGFDEISELLAQPVPWAERIDDLADWYQRHGYGAALYAYAFEIEGSMFSSKDFKPVEDLDLPSSAEFFLYDEQRETVRKNTEFFVSGKPAQDLLLYGDRGTGKSSTVKLMLSEFAGRGLRLVKATADVDNLEKLIKRVSNHVWKYLIFIDDISFSSFGSDALKFRSLLQGDVLERPKNVLFYVTSNRKNIVRTEVADTENYDPLNFSEDREETLALADRFGIKVWFPTPSQDEYLAIVRGLARRRGIELEDEELKSRALVWARWRNGLSPRTAEQFIKNLSAELESHI